ncbi:MAG: T9SS type B sorting domain-containing protein [Bacteroidota bacterium]
MRRILSIYIVFQLFITGLLQGQTATDDYWLNHGFTSGTTVTTNSGTFYDDGGNANYHAGQDWNVTFCSENGNPITLDFSGFATDYRGPVPPLANEYLDYDYLLIQYPGASYIAYHDDTPQFGFTSASGCMNFRFVSDPASWLESGWSAEISADPPPSNNDPCTAALLNVGNACSPQYFTNKGAYNTTNLGDPPCHSYFGGDVWFTLIVPASGQVKIETFPGTLTYAILDIYHSNDCTISGSERITCVDGLGTMPSVTLTGRTPGETLYIRLFGDQAKSGQFGICATDPAAPVTGYTGPGGVGDAASVDFWFKPDKGVLDASANPATNGVAVMTWQDQSGNGNDLVQASSGFRPVLTANAINGFGALKFDGTDDFFTRELGSKGAPVRWFTVATFEGSARQNLISLGNADVNHTASISRHTDGRYFCLSQSDRYGPNLNASQYYIFNANHRTTATRHNLRLNGSAQTVTDYTTALNTDGTLLVGSSYLNTEYYGGYLPELIQYSRTLNTAQERIVENYLAAKYNITLAANDLYSWKASHKYDVAGIGRVDASNIHTKAASAGMLTIGGASDLENNEFGFIGHDNGNADTWTTTGIPAGDPDIERLARTWRVVNAGGDGIGTVTLGLIESGIPALPSGYIAYNLLVDADGDFSSGAVAYGLIESGNELVANSISLNNGDYIAIAAVKPVISFQSASSSGLESVLHPQIRVNLNYACSDVVVVDYSVSGGTATTSTDYSLVTGFLTFNPGERTKYIIPLIVNDTIPEIPDEYFDIQISTSTAGVTVGTPSAHRYTILNDDLSADATASRILTGACASSNATLYASYEGTGPFTIAWSPATGLSATNNDTVTASPAVTTLYTLRVTDGLGQYREDTITIFVDPLPLKPVITESGSTTFCEGGSVTLGTSAAYDAYLWSDNSAGSTLEVSASGTFAVTGIDTFGCQGPASDAVTVTVNPVPAKPVIAMTGTTEFCSYDSLILVAPAGYDTYKWNGVAGDDTLVVKTSGTYSVTVGWSTGCESQASDALTVTVHDAPAQPVITESGSTTFCDGSSVTLGVNTTFDSYLWSDGSSAATLEVSTTGSYTVTGTDSYGCDSPESAAVTVTVNPVPAKPVIAMTGTTEFCSYDSLILVAPAGYDTYKWNGVAGDDTLVVKTSGTYSVTVGWSTGCESQPSDALTVTVHDAPAQPVITESGSTTFCEGSSVTLGVNTTFDTYLWSDGSTAATLEVNTTGSYTVTGTDSYGCDSPESAAVTVTVNPVPAKPVIAMTGTMEFCSYDSLILVAPAGYDTYKWNGVAGDDTLVVKTSGTYSVTVGWSTGCESQASDALTVTVHDAPAQPVITESGSSTFCEGSSVTLAVNTTFDSYLWSDGSTAATLEVSTTGSYTVTGTDSYGCDSPESAAVTVTVNPVPAKPVISMTGTTEFCSYDSLILVAPAGYDTYKWNGVAGDDTLVVKNSGTYSVTVGWSTGCESQPSDPVVVTVHQAPAQALITPSGSSFNICEGESQILGVSTTFNSYLWSDGSTAATLEVSTSGSYTVTGTDSYGCDSPESAAVTVTVNPVPAKPVISMTGTTEFCSYDSLILVAPAGFDTYLWNGVSGDDSLIVRTSGIYHLEVGWSSGCISPVSDDISVTVHSAPAKPVISWNGVPDFCEGDSVQLDAPAGYQTYFWSDGSDKQTHTIKSSASLKLYVEDTNGCYSPESDEISLTVHALPPAPVITNNGLSEFCEGGSTELEATSGYSLWHWNTGETTMSVTVGSSGGYTVTGENEYGCISLVSAEVLVTVNPRPEQPVISYTTPLTFFVGDSVVLTSTTGETYLWEPGNETSSAITVKTSGDYRVQTGDTKGCLSEWSEVVSVLVKSSEDKPEVSASGPLGFCDGGSVLLSGPEGFESYAWSDGQSTREITVTQSGQFWLIVTNSLGFESVPSDTFDVIVYPLPEISLVAADDPLCYGGSDGTISISVAQGTEPYTYEWSIAGTSGPDATNLGKGDYSVTVSDQHSCQDDLSVSLSQPEELQLSAQISDAFCPDFTDGAIEVTVTGGVEPYSYEWSNGAGAAYADQLAPGVYSLVLLDHNGCREEGSWDVGILNDACFRIPEIITPNGDNYNDTWVIDGLEAYPGVTIEVFDRWGKRVFYSEDNQPVFDGTFNGRELPMESYHYVIDLHNGSNRLIGNITIIR